MNRRQSTNVKLVAIINSKNNDQEEEEAVQNVEYKAKCRLRRTSLYGGGARTKIPKIKLNKKSSQSPFTITDVAPDYLKQPKKLESSIPPGAHADQFRVVTNSTRRSYNDPDRVCINSTTMMDGLQVISQPPWYFGNTNTIAPPDITMLTAAARYGFRGSKNIQQYNTNPYEMPSKTRTEYTPKFLDNGDFVNEWVPPIVAAPNQTINGLETPKLWPENTEFVNGYRHKKQPKSWIYKRETTVARDERPKTSETLNTLMNKTTQQDDLLREYSRLESTSAFLSLPMTVQNSFDATWKDKVNTLANSALKYNLKRTKESHEAHALVDPSDVIKYSGTTAMIVHSQTTDELKFRIRMDRSRAKNNTPFGLKWQHAIMHFKNISAQLKRNQVMSNAIQLIASSLERSAVAGGSGTSLSRPDFMTACGIIMYLEGTPQKQLSLLYSLFDPMKKNNVRFVEIINCWAVLDRPLDPPLEKLRTLWKINAEFGQDRNVLDMALEVLTVCCSSLQDQKRMSLLFQTEFRPKCYDMSMQFSSSHSSASPSFGATGNTFNTGAQSSRVGTANTVESVRTVATTASAAVTVSDRGDTSRPGTGAAAAMAEKKSNLSIQPQYNICEHFLNASTFVKVLAACPSIVNEFDAQLGLQLVACYGKDDRYREEEVDVGDVNRDFTWILKKGEAPQREVFTVHS